MTESMIDRVAKAICGHFGDAFDDLPASVSYIERKSSDRPGRRGGGMDGVVLNESGPPPA